MLITGDMGFVGRNFSRYLHGTGEWQVGGFDLRDTSRTDARDYFRHAWRRYDLVIHCAAIVGGRDIIEGDPLALMSNLEIDAGLFQWAKRTTPGRILYFSSSAAYPVSLQRGVPEVFLAEHEVSPDYVRTPDQLYGWSKVTGEMLAARANESGIPTTVVRPFSGYGEDQDTSYPFAAFAERARHRADPFEVWGDGSQARDFIHISDIIQACMLLVQLPVTGPVNLGCGRATTMLELAEMFCREAGYDPRIQALPGKPSGVRFRVANTARMRDYYSPEVSLEEGIRRLLAREDF